MNIHFLVNHVFSGWSPTDTRLGGTEESIVRWAEYIANKGHNVTVYMNGYVGEHNKVAYKDRFTYQGGGDVCVNVKSSEVAPKEPTLYLTNETNATEKDLSMYDAVIWPSHWAEEHIPVNNPVRHILPHGYDSNRIYPDTKIAKQCLYASSPDRGLSVLLEAWPKIYAAHPDATLLVTYGAKVSLPGVICLGDVDEDTMDELYRTSEYWLHPCLGGELFGITGIKAQAAHCWPVYVPTMALAETVKYGTESSFETFADDVIKVMSWGVPTIPDLHYPNWEETGEQLLELLENTLQS